jgi:hypothetical protein
MDNFIYPTTNPTNGGVTCQQKSFWHPIPKAIPKKLARKKTTNSKKTIPLLPIFFFPPIKKEVPPQHPSRLSSTF